ncbi:MAG: hypothetical protein ABSA67_11395 [Candidatus Brocadiia bacterium]
MSRERLRDLRMDTSGAEVRYERMPQRVEVHYAASRVLVPKEVRLRASLEFVHVGQRLPQPGSPRGQAVGLNHPHSLVAR